MTDQSIEDASRNSIIEDAENAGVSRHGYYSGYLFEDGLFQFDEKSLIKFCQLREARQSSQSVDDKAYQGEPVYQLGHANIFKDVRKEEYESARYIDKRIVYATPQQAIPSEPTKEMIEAFFEKLDDLGYSPSKIDLTVDDCKECYKAMLSASPTAPIESDK
jgi:hypothetical protein